MSKTARFIVRLPLSPFPSLRAEGFELRELHRFE